MLTDLVADNWPTFLIVIVFLLFRYKKAQSKYSIKAKKLVSFINNGNAHILDIRNKEDFYKESILSSLLFSPDDINSIEVKNKKLIIVSKTGRQARRLVEKIMQIKDFEAFYLYGGINAWKKSKLPLLEKTKNRS